MAQKCIPSIPNNTPDNRYINHNNGTVTDKNTGLMWKQCIEGLSGINTCTTGSPSYYTLIKSLEFAEGQLFAGYSDWRVPTLTELKSLIAQHCLAPSVNIALFPNDPASYVWSSSLSVNNAKNAWYVIFNNGYADNGFIYDFNRVRFVRAGLKAGVLFDEEPSLPLTNNKPCSINHK